MLQPPDASHNMRAFLASRRMRGVVQAATFLSIVLAALASLLPSAAAPTASVPPGPLLYFNATTEIRRYNGITGELVDVFVPPAAGEPHYFTDMAFGPDNNLYVIDGLYAQVLRYDGQTGTLIDTFIPAHSAGLVSAYHMTFGPDRNLYIGGQDASDLFNSKVVRYNPATGALIDTFIPALNRNQVTVQDLVFGGDGNLYLGAVALAGTDGYVLKYDGTTGALITTFIPPGTASLHGFPWGITFGPACSLYLLLGGGIQRFDAASGAFLGTLAQIAHEGFGTQDMIAGPDGNLYVSIQSTNEVVRYNSITGAFIDTFIPASKTNAWNSIAFHAPPADLQTLVARIYVPAVRAC